MWFGFPLDLSDADTSGFEPVEPARYNAEIVKAEQDATTNPNGNLPVGTPMLKLQFKLLDEGVENRRVFSQFFFPPKDGYDEKKRATMLGMFVNFLGALGYEESKVKSPDFQLDYEDLVGQALVVQVGREPKKDKEGNVIEGEFNNPVKGYKPAGSLTGGNTSQGLL